MKPIHKASPTYTKNRKFKENHAFIESQLQKGSYTKYWIVLINSFPPELTARVISRSEVKSRK